MNGWIVELRRAVSSTRQSTHQSAPKSRRTYLWPCFAWLSASAMSRAGFDGGKSVRVGRGGAGVCAEIAAMAARTTVPAMTGTRMITLLWSLKSPGRVPLQRLSTHRHQKIERADPIDRDHDPSNRQRLERPGVRRAGRDCGHDVLCIVRGRVKQHRHQQAAIR